MVVARRHADRVARRKFDHVWSIPSATSATSLIFPVMSISSVKCGPDGAVLTSVGELCFLPWACVAVVLLLWEVHDVRRPQAAGKDAYAGDIIETLHSHSEWISVAAWSS